MARCPALEARWRARAIQRLAEDRETDGVVKLKPIEAGDWQRLIPVEGYRRYCSRILREARAHPESLRAGYRIETRFMRWLLPIVASHLRGRLGQFKLRAHFLDLGCLFLQAGSERSDFVLLLRGCCLEVLLL